MATNVSAKFIVRPATPRELWDKFIAITQALEISHITSCTVESTIEGLASGIPSGPVSLDTLLASALPSFIQQLETVPCVNLRHMRFSYAPDSGISYGYEDPQHPHFFAMTVTAPDMQALLRMISVVSKHFDLKRKVDLQREDFPKEVNDRIATYDSMITDLSQSVAKLHGVVTDEVAKQNSLYNDRMANLEQSFEGKRASLEADTGRERERLATIQADLDEKAKEFDIRKAMIARRATFTEFKKLLQDQDRVCVSKETQDKRIVIHIVCSIALILTGIVPVLTAVAFVLGHSTQWQMIIPSAISSVLFATTLAFYLAWANSWFATLARAELTNTKQRADIIRANWIAELFLESKESQSFEIPLQLLETFSQNLFDNVEWKDKDGHHPLEKLLRQLERVTSFDVTKNGISVRKK